MKMWSVTVIILLLFCYACLSTANERKVKVRFRSENFFNFLHWDPVDPALFPEEKVTYSVVYKSDSGKERYQIKPECQNITALSCDLTNETPYVYDVHYYARVLVNGQLHGTTIHKFKPSGVTHLSRPTLSKAIRGSSLSVNVTLPLGPNGTSVGDIFTSRKAGPADTVILYILKITKPEWAVQDHENTNGQFVINLTKKANYCGHVIYKPSCVVDRPWSEEASFCATLSADPLPWLLTGAALMTAIIILSAVCVCKYVKGGKQKSMPQQLEITSSTSPRILQSLDGGLIISKPVICNTSDHQTVYATIQVKPTVPSVGVGGYSPQDIPCQSWQSSTASSVDASADSSATNREDTSAQSSEIYSVVAVHVPPEERAPQQDTITDKATTKVLLSPSGGSCDKSGMSPKLTSPGISPLPIPEPNSNSVRLNTVRDSNGQLMLPLFNFQIQSSPGDTERKPLLSDLIESKQDGPTLVSLQSFDGSEWSDSGCDDSMINTPTQPYCNTNYCPSQPVVPYIQQGNLNTSSSSDATLESGYKQNWMRSILLECSSKDRCEYRSTNYPWTRTGDKTEEGEEDRGGEESSNKIVLGSWVLQIQD